MGAGAKQTNLQFQFTGLIRGPTVKMGDGKLSDGISIHRPHTRPDTMNRRPAISRINFNSQASYEARLFIGLSLMQFSEFQFTGLIRGPTTNPRYVGTAILDFNSQASYEARLRAISLLQPER